MAYIDLNETRERGSYWKWKKAIEDQTPVDFETVRKNSPLLIPENDLEEYAKEYAKDMGAIQNEYSWPANCIDWQQAVEEMLQEFREIEVDGINYYFRDF